MQESNNYLMMFLVFSFVWLLLFLIGRQIVCWYWKINRHIELQEQILVELKKMNNKETGAPKTNNF